MITVYILLCMAAPGTPVAVTEAEKRAHFEFWRQCDSSNSQIYKTVIVSGKADPCSPEAATDFTSPDMVAVDNALPDPWNPAWAPPNWVKFECHKVPAS
jgi:hypothetical protein